MDWALGYEGADIQALAESAASTYWWPLLAWATTVGILVSLAVLITRCPVRRRFRCEQAGREVEVAFEEDVKGHPWGYTVRCVRVHTGVYRLA